VGEDLGGGAEHQVRARGGTMGNGMGCKGAGLNGGRAVPIVRGLPPASSHGRLGRQHGRLQQDPGAAHPRTRRPLQKRIIGLLDKAAAQRVGVPALARTPCRASAATPEPVAAKPGFPSAAGDWMGEPERPDLALVPPALGRSDERWTLGAGLMEYEANYQRINDNLCDFSHLSFLHVDSFGGGRADNLKDFAGSRPTVEPLARGIRVTRWTTGREAPPYLGGMAGRPVDAFMSDDYLAPGVLLTGNALYMPSPGGRAAARTGPI
jgi:hypothetical protein